MPRKKQRQTRAEISAEQFFPVESRDIKYSVEKPHKTIDRESLVTVEKEGKSVIKKGRRARTPRTIKKKSPKEKVGKSTGKKKKASSNQIQEFNPKNVKLKSDGYELVVTEKPQAALKIASALGKATQRNVGSVSYYEVDRNGKRLVVACAVGHLFTLTQSSRGSEIPVFNIKWVPNYMARKGDFSKKYYDVLVKLVKGAGSITIATDYDVEGEVIGLNVVRFIGNQPDAGRMKFSTLTEKELNESYESKSKSIDWGQAIAGETRHYLDWFYGINLSRALMNALKSIGKFKIMSIGRVQGPALNLIVQKERQILEFKSQPYWQVFITLENPKIELQHNRDFFKKTELEKFQGLKGKIADVSTEKKQQSIPPNPPFNLTTLQTEAYRLFGINPAKTLQLAQSLYLAGLISYPRTSSQKLPPSIGYLEILEKLAKRYNVESLISRKTPVEGKKTDPAHPSIYPTGQQGSGALGDDEKKIYELIVKRFLSLFMEDAIVENKTIIAKVNGLIFNTKGSVVSNKGWFSIYPIKISESNLPDVNGKIKISKLDFKEKETQPPRRFSPASLVSELEKRNLGTKATRASILETLYQRGYVQDQSIKATPLGISLISTLEKHSPIIIDEALTRSFEKEMDLIQKLKSGLQEKEAKIIDKAKSTITKISEQFAKEETEIGKELSEANTKIWAQQKEENKLNQCPLCKKGNLQIMYSKKTGRYFVGCSSYPECKNTYSLPPNALLKKSDKTCEHCGFPMLLSIKRGKRPWIFCFNPECETNKKRLEEYRRRKEEENNNS
jgi:DNA topoisomerase-1